MDIKIKTNILLPIRVLVSILRTSPNIVSLSNNIQEELLNTSLCVKLEHPIASIYLNKTKLFVIFGGEMISYVFDVLLRAETDSMATPDDEILRLPLLRLVRT